jgi:hypothetical protein
MKPIQNIATVSQMLKGFNLKIIRAKKIADT